MTTETRPVPTPVEAPPTRPPNHVWIIFRKEFFEIFRDRRTIISVIISPLLITPAIFALLGVVISGQAQKARTQTYTVGIVGGPSAPVVLHALQKTPNLRVVPVPLSKAETQIKNHDLSAVAVLPDDTHAALREGRTLSVTILEDAGNQTSQTAAERLNATLGAIGQQVVAQRLRAHHLPPEYAQPFTIEEKPIKQGGSTATFFLAMMLPYILSVSAFSGAIYAAFDQVAGEKERGTLETLLVSPASRRAIVLGKFGAVVAVCLISSLLAIAGMAITFGSGLKQYAWLSKGGLHLGPAAICVTLLVLLPLSVLFAGLLLAVSTFARNQKEAQTYLAPLFILVLAPAMISMFLNTDVGLSVALAPVLNAAIIIKQALSGTYDLAFILLASAASVLYAAVALTFATKLFQKESVLIKS